MRYEFKKGEGKEPGSVWTDRQGNTLRVPDSSWDPVLKNERGTELKAFLEKEGYEGPGDWNPW